MVEHNGTLVLVDCGFSLRELTLRLERLSLKPDQLSAVLVTHEHSDHARGVALLARRHGVKVYCSEGTAMAAGLTQDGVDLLLVDGSAVVEHEELLFQPVPVPHDARQPTQFVFQAAGAKLGILTDLGSVSTEVLRAFRDCDGLVLECNHDQQMLATGPYPARLKRRVAGPFGHLSNDQAARLLSSIDRERLQHLVLAHLSEKNNRPERALEAIAAVYGRMGRVAVACQDTGFGWREFGAGPQHTFDF